MKALFLKIFAAFLGIFLASKFIPGVNLKVEDRVEKLRILFLIGIILGALNFFLKPILKIFTLPLRILTFGFFSFIINLLIVEIVDILFLELEILGVKPLFLTSLLVWSLEFFLNLIL